MTGSEETQPESSLFLSPAGLSSFLLFLFPFLPPLIFPLLFLSIPPSSLPFLSPPLPQLGIQGMINMSVNSSWSLAFVQGGVSDSDSLSMRKPMNPFPTFYILII